MKRRENSMIQPAGFIPKMKYIGPPVGGVQRTGVKKNANWTNDGKTTFKSFIDKERRANI